MTEAHHQSSAATADELADHLDAAAGTRSDSDAHLMACAAEMLRDIKKLRDPAAVHINMLRGTIAKPSWANIKHLYPEQFTDDAQAEQVRLATIKECAEIAKGVYGLNAGAIAAGKILALAAQPPAFGTPEHAERIINGAYEFAEKISGRAQPPDAAGETGEFCTFPDCKCDRARVMGSGNCPAGLPDPNPSAEKADETIANLRQQITDLQRTAADAADEAARLRSAQPQPPADLLSDVKELISGGCEEGMSLDDIANNVILAVGAGPQTVEVTETDVRCVIDNATDVSFLPFGIATNIAKAILEKYRLSALSRPACGRDQESGK